MEDSKILGIHILHSKEFHHYVTGIDSQQLSIDRLRNTLMARGLLRVTESNATQYRVCSLEEAKSEGWNIVPHYANKHVAQKAVKQAAKKDLIALWD